MSEVSKSSRKICYGSRAVALRAYGDERLATTVRKHPEGLPLFLIGNTLCGFADAIDAAMAAKEAAGLVGLRPLKRKHPSARNLEPIT